MLLSRRTGEREESTYLIPELVVELVNFLSLHLPLVLSGVAREFLERVGMPDWRRRRRGRVVVDDGSHVRDRVWWTHQVVAS